MANKPVCVCVCVCVTTVIVAGRVTTNLVRRHRRHEDDVAKTLDDRAALNGVLGQ